MTVALATAREWQIDHQLIAYADAGSADAMHKLLALAIKTLLTSFDANPWVVRGSSNGTAGALDGVDRWTAAADIKGGSGAPHSWTVLRQPATGMELCIDFAAANVIAVDTVISLAGFSGGDASARPTAVDERVLLTTSAAWYMSFGATVDSHLHVWHSNDGKNSVVLIAANGPPREVHVLWILGAAGAPVDAWDTPMFGLMKGSNGSSAYLGVVPLFFGAPATVLSWQGGAPMDLRGVGRATRHGTTGLVEPDWLFRTQAGLHGLRNAAPMWPLGLWGSTVGKRGYHGHIPDLWLGLKSHASGTAYPGDGSRRFMKLGDYVFPWDGSALT